MNLVETFMENEKLKCNWLEKKTNTYPEFYFSKDIPLNLKHQNIDQAFIIRPSKFKRFIATLFICVGLFGWFSIFLVVIQKILLPISIIFLLLISAWIGLIIWVTFLNPKLSYKITIDKDKIKLGKQTYEWHNISEYLLLVKGSFKQQETTLVLFIDNKLAIKYNLNNLNRSGEEIIKRIELYKK